MNKGLAIDNDINNVIMQKHIYFKKKCHLIFLNILVRETFA